ncbi:MAG: DUF3592 domain-containing protein [Chloroflexi bacterium]|nr:DUF3592 domain-containing protein [Chloroflexota bacterium]
MDAYEKSVDKAVNAVEKVASGANRLYIGCITILANLFFMAFCLWGVYAAYTSWQLETNGERTTGVVVRLLEQSDSDGGCCTYVPVVQFEAGGSTYSFEGDTASYPPQYEVGEEVSVLYDPSSPNTAQIDKFSERWLMPLILIPAMILASIILTFFMIRAWRRGETILE